MLTISYVSVFFPNFTVIKKTKPHLTDLYHTLTYAVKLASVFPFAGAWADQLFPDANLLNNGKNFKAIPAAFKCSRQEKWLVKTVK